MKFYALLLCSAALVSAAEFKTGQAARAVIGQLNFTAQSDIPSERTLGGASGLAYANNTLYVVDDNRIGAFPRDNRVLVYTDLSAFIPKATDQLLYDPNVRCPVCLAGASAVLGQSTFLLTGINGTTGKDSAGNPTGDVSAISAGGMRGPTAVATDGTRLAVADTDNNRILIWNNLPKTTNQPADLVLGQPDFTHNYLNGDPNAGHTPSAKGLSGPQGVWIQGNKLFVADTMNNRVLIWNSFPTTNGQPADVVLGQQNFNVFIEPDKTKTQVDPTVSNMDTPVAITSDGQRLFVADLGYNRVLVWNSIPTQNAYPADVVLGQPDFTSAIANNSTKQCASNGTDSSNKPTYPARCAATLNFPRYALSDGKHLFVADGGNDRVLVFNNIDTKPLSNGQAADAVLGQRSDTDIYVSNVDILGNTTQLNPDMVGSDALRTAMALASDGTNLYVSDPYNRRVLVYTPGEPVVADSGVRNAASFAIYAIGTITFAGKVTEGDSVTVTVMDKTYTYTIKKDDTFANVILGLTDAINSAPDPNVTARSNVNFNTLVLTAKAPGDAGNAVTYSVATKSSKTDGTPADITATAEAANLKGGQSGAKIAPGTLVTILGQNFTDKEYTPDPSAPLPRSLGGVEVYFDGVQSPLLYVSPTQINTQVPYTISDTTSVTSWVRSSDPSTGALRYVSTPTGVPVVLQNPGIFALSGPEPRTAIALHESGYATGAISVDGTIKAGDVATIKIADRSYSYTVTATDTLTIIRDALVAAVNADPQVRAEAAGVYQRIRLFARTAGTQGEGITYSASVNNGSGGSVILTPLGTTTCCSSVAGTLITPDNPAKPGETIVIYGTGLGLVSDASGNAITVQAGVPYSGAVLNSVNSPVDAIAGNKTANVLFAGLPQGSVGVYKLVLQLNSDLPTNDATQLTIAQDVYVSNVVTFAVNKP